MIRFIDINSGKDLAPALNQRYRYLLDRVQEIDVAPSIQKTVRNTFTRNYPGSKHWDPERVTITGRNKVHVAVPGVMRAYRDITIKPVHRQHLTIPLHAAAYGKKAPDVHGLFPFWYGGLTLAKRELGAIVPWYLLVKEVHQPQDPKLMPSDKEIYDNILTYLIREIRRIHRRKA